MTIHIPATAFWCDAVTKKADPTGTLDIRKRLSSMLAMRFRKVLGLVRTNVVENDVLGLKPASISPLALAGASGNREIGFQTWLDNLLRAGVSEDGQWMRPMLAISYSRAVRRAQRLTRSVAVPRDMAETIDVLTTLAFTELQGICEAVSQRCLRAAATGWLHNAKPIEAFNEMRQAIDAVGVVRSGAMAQLMVVKSFTAGTLDTFVAVGVKQVGLIPETLQTKRPTKDAYSTNFGFEGFGSRMSREVQPSSSTIYRITKQEENLEEDLSAEGDTVEVATAGDNDVCPECDDIEGNNPYSIDEARSLIPAHPNCRCAFVPVDNGSGWFSSVTSFIGSFFESATIFDMNENHDPKTGEFTSGEGQKAFIGHYNKAVANHLQRVRKMPSKKHVEGALTYIEKHKPDDPHLPLLRTLLARYPAGVKNTSKYYKDMNENHDPKTGQFAEGTGPAAEKAVVAVKVEPPTAPGRDTPVPKYEPEVKKETNYLDGKLTRHDFEAVATKEVSIASLKSPQRDYERRKVDMLKSMWDHNVLNTDPIYVLNMPSGNQVIWGGNHRVIAASELGHKTIPAKVITISAGEYKDRARVDDSWRHEDYNENHDPKTGEFSEGSGSAGAPGKGDVHTKAVGLKASEKRAIAHYTEINHSIDEYLRDPRGFTKSDFNQAVDAQQTIQDLNSAIAKSKLTEDLRIHSGVSNWSRVASLKAGDTYAPNRFISGSTDKTIAQAFSGGAKGGILTLDLPKGTNVVQPHLFTGSNASITTGDPHPNNPDAEHYLREVILGTSQQYEVISVGSNSLHVRAIAKGTRDWADYNENHDPKTGEFTFGQGGAGSIGGHSSPGPVMAIHGASPEIKAKAEDVAKAVDEVAAKLNFDPAIITITGEERTFMLNGERKVMGGWADHNLGRVFIALNNDPAVIRGLIAHEVMHLKFESFMKAYAAERAAVSRGADVTKYPLYQAYAKEIEGNTAQMAKEDGVSDYSRAWWTSFNNGEALQNQAYHETLAEMARLNYTARVKFAAPPTLGKKGFTSAPSKLWKSLYDMVNAHWSSSRKGLKA